jgi:hypothetical protein
VSLGPQPGSGGLSLAIKLGVLAVIVATGAVAVFFGGVILDRLTGKSESVVGEYVSRHLGLKITFPRGWRHAKALDTSETRTGMTTRMAVFFRGGSAKNPDTVLLVGLADVSSPVERNEMRKDILAATRSVVPDLVRDSKAMPAGKLSVPQCNPIPIGGAQGGLCAGTAEGSKHREVVLVAWPTEQGMGFGAYVTAEDASVAKAEAEALLRSIEFSRVASGSRPSVAP